jgi:hypothetical protein
MLPNAAAEYREAAQSCRTKAATAKRDDEKAEWLRMAGEWDAMAAARENRRGPAPPPPAPRTKAKP